MSTTRKAGMAVTRVFWMFLFCISLAVGALVNLPGPAASAAVSAAPDGFVSVYGWVIGPDGEPVAGASVLAWTLGNTGWTEVDETSTDSAGTYESHLKPGGTYSVLASAPGLRTTWLGDVYVRDNATRFVATEGMTLDPVQLLQANEVSGAVTYKGRPLYSSVDLYRWVAPTHHFAVVSETWNS